MKFLYSLKYRIALTIFVIQLVIVAALLWQTQSSAFHEAQRLLRSQDQTVLQVLSSVSEASLLNEDYFNIQPFYTQIVESPHIITAFLLNHLGVVVVSSNSALLGKTDFSLERNEKSYWITSVFEDGFDNIGELKIQFSQTEIDNALEKTRQQSLYLGLIGVLVSALLSIIMGHVLTTRLEKIKRSTERFASGDLDARCELTGHDELSDLSQSLNLMADQISSNIKKIEHLAFHDALTGLANRREFDKRLSLAFEAAKKHGNFYALLYLDLDKFKIVNDTCGHQAGDQLLIELSTLMLDVLRQRDTLVRFGGDEFGILLENCPLSQAEEVANKLIKAVGDYKFPWHDKVLQVGVSIGGVTLNARTQNLDQLLSSADAACYTAKQRGRNQVHLVSPSDTGIRGHFTDIDWIHRLSTLIDEDLFSMAFQKIMPLQSSGEAPRVEFLLRMQNERKQWISPAVFIDAAERFDSIQGLDRYVINKVFRIIALDKLPVKNVMCFINLSGKSIGEKSLYNYVCTKIKEYNLDASKICFEITETAAIASFNHASIFIDKARALGCSFALDDFGSGMCSFSYLKNLQVDYVKIDGSFILSMAKNDVDRAIVKSINNISHRSGYKTIAEFVETESILNQTTELKVDFAQGYGLHKPEVIKDR